MQAILLGSPTQQGAEFSYGDDDGKLFIEDALPVLY